MSDAKVYIDAGNELHGAIIETNPYVVNISRQYARIFSYDDYLVSAGVVAPSAQPTSLTFTNVTSTSYDVSFTASVGGADGYVAFRRTGASPTFVPVDTTTYTVGNTYGDSTCQHFGAGVTFSESGLTSSTTYYYDVFAWNGAVGTYVYLGTSPLEGSQATAFSFGNALHFDGTNDRVDTLVDNFGVSNKLSLMFWCKYDNTSALAKYMIAVKNDAFSQGYFVLSNESAGRLSFYVASAFRRITLASPTDWNFIEIYYDGTQAVVADRVIMKVNNSVASQTIGIAMPATIPPVTTTVKTINFGCYRTNAGGYAGFYDGRLDEVAFYNTVNEQNGIDMYNSGNGATPPTTGRIGYYKFNSVSPSTTVTDEDGTNSGTLVNSNFDADSGWEAH